MDHALVDVIAKLFGGEAETLCQTFHHAVYGFNCASLKLSSIAQRTAKDHPPYANCTSFSVDSLIAAAVIA
jgi:hypothetical protein